MAYTPTDWGTGDTITASAMNKLENAVANAGGGGVAAIRMSASEFSSSSKVFGFFAYACYNDVSERWEFQNEDVYDWNQVFGFAEPSNKLFLYLIPPDDDIGLFFIPYSIVSGVVVNGDIDSNQTLLYYPYGSAANGYRITGSGSIECVA